MLSDYGWDARWAGALDALPRSAGLAPARVTAVHRGRVHVVGEAIDRPVPVGGSVDGAVVVGDWVGFDGEQVKAILPRRTLLAREDAMLAANVDLGVAVASGEAQPDLRRIERFVSLATAGGIEPLVVLTKGDLSADPAAAAAEVERELGIEALILGAGDRAGLDAVRRRLAPRTTSVLIGMSGVGKSTLLNALLGEDRQRTLPVRERDGAGRHATVHRELFTLDNGALVIDTPGMRRPSMAAAGDRGDVADAFADIEELAKECRFADCRHDREPGCAVRGVVSEARLESMRALGREGTDAATRISRRRSDPDRRGF